MQRNQYIRSFVSVLLLMVFVLGITPKKVLHNWLANHSDQKPVGVQNKHTVITYAGYQCNVENLVAESPFNDKVPPVISVTETSFVTAFSIVDSPLYVQCFFTTQLRGPPVYQII